MRVSLIIFVVQQLGNPADILGGNVQTVVSVAIIFALSKPVSVAFVVEVENVRQPPRHMDSVVVLILPFTGIREFHLTFLFVRDVVIKKASAVRAFYRKESVSGENARFFRRTVEG